MFLIPVVWANRRDYHTGIQTHLWVRGRCSMSSFGSLQFIRPVDIVKLQILGMNKRGFEILHHFNMVPEYDLECDD